MKQGTNFILPVSIEYDLSLIDKIEFVFKQTKDSLPVNHCFRNNDYDVEKIFEYPSDTATIDDDTNSINLHWTKEDTFMFNTSEVILMDTRIHLKGSVENPITDIVRLKMQPTLFTE